MTGDPEAGRLLAEFDRQLESLSRQEQSGLPITDAQRMQLESLQGRIVSNLKIKALNLAQVDFVDLLRKVSQAVQRPALEAQGQGQGGPGAVGGGGAGRGRTAARHDAAGVTAAYPQVTANTIQCLRFRFGGSVSDLARPLLV